MQLIDLETGVSPETTKSIRQTAKISHGDNQTIILWVDVPEAYAEGLSDTGNPWLLAMLPMAASLGEDIELALPVDALLLENVKGVLALWREWYPELHDVRIHCPVLSYRPSQTTRTAAFFSGGIDSYFTIARRMPGNAFGIPAVGKVDDLLTVWGFDVGVYDEAQFRPLADKLAGSAAAMNLNHIIVRTNLREAAEVFKKSWGPLTFGAGLAFIGAILERRFGEVVLGSSYPYGGLMPWGSHPMVDILFSTSSLGIAHDGASFTRIGKTEIMARLPEAEKSLHVCQAAGIENCSQCEKCYRTMIALDILGKRKAFTGVFDWTLYVVEKIKTLYIGGGGAQIFYHEMVSVAKDAGRTDIATALLAASRRSSRMAPLVHWADWLARQPVVWRFGVALRALVLSGSIGPQYIRHAAKASVSG
ncbi:MAG: hypothetical protein HZB64_01525 [Rhodocyclales bacterium]|nr:hypothetical protein [Rhodocyclales bacterium]